MSHHDLLRPPSAESQKILNHSRNIWYSLLRQAELAKYLPRPCLDVTSLLNKTPSIPLQPLQATADDVLFIRGFSQWTIGSNDCELDTATKCSHRLKIVIGSQRPQFCRVATALSFPIGCKSSDTHARNLVCPLFLGWSYILSTRLLELQGIPGVDRVMYSDKTAEYCIESSHDEDYLIPVDSHDGVECRWWAAILAQGAGWQAVINRSGVPFYPPWSCHLQEDQHFKFRASPAAAFISASPPSSDQALQFLCDFAVRQSVQDQLLAALVAALTIPTHTRFGAPIELPSQRQTATSFDTKSKIAGNISLVDVLPNLMALSCIPNVITSSLLGSFWQHDIPCNLASAWLWPILHEIAEDVVRRRRYDTIVHMMAARSPNVAPFWLGCAITGLLPRFIQIAKSYLPTLSLEAAAWLVSPQSFLDTPFIKKPEMKHSKGRQLIRREDEVRLLYITDLQSDKYGPPLLCPWAPFGWVDLEGCSIEVRKHALCNHSLEYQSWVWIDDAGNHHVDSGMSLDKQIATLSCWSRLLHRFCDFERRLHELFRHQRLASKAKQNILRTTETLSRSATRNFFTWYWLDGTRPEDSHLLKHEWLSSFAGRDAMSTISSTASSS